MNDTIESFLVFVSVFFVYRLHMATYACDTAAHIVDQIQHVHCVRMYLRIFSELEFSLCLLLPIEETVVVSCYDMLYPKPKHQQPFNLLEYTLQPTYNQVSSITTETSHKILLHDP